MQDKIILLVTTAQPFVGMRSDKERVSEMYLGFQKACYYPLQEPTRKSK